MIKRRRAAAAGLPASRCCHTFQGTDIAAYLSNGGTLEHAQRIAGHASPKTTKLYDRTADTILLDEIERFERTKPLTMTRRSNRVRWGAATTRSSSLWPPTVCARG